MQNKQDFKIHPQSSFNYKYIEMASKLRAAGFSLKDIGYAFGMSPSTITSWAKNYPQFKRALEEGKEVAKSYVVSKAFKAACGYEYEDENIKYDAEGNVKERSVFKKQQPPNPKLIMWLLCNLDPKEWKSEHKILVENDQTITVKLDGKAAAKQIEKLAGKLLGGEKPKRKIIEAEIIEEQKDDKENSNSS